MPRLRCWLVGSAGAILLLLGGCASTPQATAERDADAKRFVPQPGYAAIYVYRPDFPAAYGEYVDSVLWLDNRLIGQTLPGTFYRFDARAGAHLIHGDGPDQGRLKLDAQSGEVYFVRLNVFGRTSHFTRVDAETGRKELLRCCALLENWAPGQRPLLR